MADYRQHGGSERLDSPIAPKDRPMPLLDDYLAFALNEDPIEATRLGIHDHDERLGDYSADALTHTAARRTAFIEQLESVDQPRWMPARSWTAPWPSST
ncbi:MAG: hypothetical protein R2856_00200 [Caldilineaceae bacterium]